jgi:hypothetical protein
MDQSGLLTSLNRITLDALTGSIIPGKLEPLLRDAAQIIEHEKKAPASPLQHPAG